ncbi:MAG: lamin tail domain-containing protein [Candidatus Moraniibacteriota bacterium]
MIALFCLGKNCLAEDSISHLIINEIQISGGTGKTENDFVEIYNPTNASINLKGYRLVKRTKTGTTDTSIKSWASDTQIISKDYHLWANSKDGFADNLKADSATAQTISNDNGIALRKGSEDTGEIIDSVGWGNCQNIFVEKTVFPQNPLANKSLERTEHKDSNDNSSDFSVQETPSPTHSKPPEPTPELIPITPPTAIEVKNYTGKLKINEVFPAPKTKNAGKEFVEIINISDETISLSGMWIEDEKNHKVTFPEKPITPKELIYLEGDFEFNNTSPDTAFLVPKDGTKEHPIDSVSYVKPKYDYAYAWNGSAWQWTSKDTKGVENQFDELLSAQIEKDKTIYVGIYANFEAKANEKAKHFTWDFGDSHKSYLQKTRHKYEKVGTYAASLKITGDGEDNVLNFEVVVEKFGKAKVRIISLSPNPKGKDSKYEWLEIWNDTKKKVNLKGWSIATGWKNLYNHPINKKFILKAGETKKLTRDFCAFSLGNKQAKIELRYPDGKVADKLKYDRKDDSISEDELYQKDDNDWQWTNDQNNTEAETLLNTEIISQNNKKITETIPENNQEAVINNSEESKNNDPGPKEEKTDFDLSELGKYSENPNWSAKREKQITLLFAGSNISPSKKLSPNRGLVLGAATTKNISQKTTITKSSNQFWKKINAKLNEIILML